MNTIKILLSLFFLMFLTTVKNLNAQQQFLLSNSVFSNGFTNATNSSFQIGSTFGQISVGMMSNSNYMAGIGFWYSVSDIQTDVDEELKNIPHKYHLYQNYPNPFNPSTTIKFSLLRTEEVKVTVFNEIGQKVAILINKTMPTGYHEVEFNAQYLPSGIYVYKIKAGQFQDVKKMLLLK